MRAVAATTFISLLSCTSGLHASDSCKHDEARMLAMDESAFDQDLSGREVGWRAIASTPGCELVAADLLATYRAKHPGSGSILAWHEGQLRASAGQYERAMPLLESGRKPPDQDFLGWNHYVDASLAFLRRDRSALLTARNRLSAVAFPKDVGMPPPKDGVIELPTAPGQPPLRMRWPLNIDVVDGLIACFDRPYSDAYSAACRPPLP